MKIEGIESILDSSFGQWSSGLFSAIGGYNPGITFADQKQAFFYLLRQLLEQGKVRFCPPNELWREGYDIWDADVSTIMDYWESHWPGSVISENDILLANYFYDMPAILWVASDGTLHGS
ncbi:TPA: hypothetical protein QDC22_002914 [Burkholderia stabilis]|nr:hypothetical protein [Burkholderia stabilis]HDR9649063.1 hypothetical protein [Burkholderia stabilis]HDR9658548.1 hypothetical protein [Burkholderia stabilis]HDR9679308.1 hypothetical protein [Burkholderia stabilis]